MHLDLQDPCPMGPEGIDYDAVFGDTYFTVCGVNVAPIFTTWTASNSFVLVAREEVKTKLLPEIFDPDSDPDQLTVTIDGVRGITDFVSIEGTSVKIEASKAEGPGLYFGQVILSDGIDETKEIFTVFIEEAIPEEPSSGDDKDDGKTDGATGNPLTSPRPPSDPDCEDGSDCKSEPVVDWDNAQEELDNAEVCYDDGTCEQITSILEDYFASSDLMELCEGDTECLDYYTSMNSDYFEQFDDIEGDEFSIEEMVAPPEVESCTDDECR